MNEPILKIDGISKSFGGVVALTDVRFEVEPNTIKSVIGPNGAGKTTLFNCITGIYQVDAGRCLLQGEDLTNRPPHIISRKGMVRTFQNVRLFGSMTVMENVMVGMHGRTKAGLIGASLKTPRAKREEKLVREKSAELLDFVGLADYAIERADSLPFGRGRVLEIARALAAEPAVLLFDEPAAGLNPRETQQLAALLRKILDLDLTIVLVEHDMELVMEISDHIAVLNYGGLIAEGTPSEIQKNDEVIRAYLGQEI